MARIRTIKPEFFSSEDIVCLSPFARLLYVALWCEADRDGRLRWKPGTFKLRYLPADPVAVDDLCAELVSRGLVVLYGDGLAYIPTFAKHQHVNPREAASALPDPPKTDASARVGHASARVTDGACTVTDAQVGKERKGKEGDSDPDGSVSPPPERESSDAATPYDSIVALYHEALPSLPRVRVMTSKRQTLIRNRWRWVLSSRRPDNTRRATNAAEALDWLREFFALAAKNDFVIGREGRTGEHATWQADIDYLLSDRGLRQVVERTRDEA